MQSDLEYVFSPEAQAILDHFCALLDIRIAFFSPTGEPLRVGDGRPICTYCQTLRQDPAFEQRCRALDAAGRDRAARNGTLYAYCCHGGMLEAVMPVRIDGRLLGFAMIGQFRQRSRPPAVVLAKADARGRQRLCAAYRKVPCLNAARSRHVLGLFETLVRHIIASRLVDRQDLLASILERLRDKPARRLPLREAAAAAGCSPSQLTRLLRKGTGHGYERNRMELLLEKADVLLRVKPALRIQEIAFQLGFEDPLYFSRIYRKHRGVSPRTARSQEAAAAGGGP